MAPRVLIVLTSHNQLGDSGKPTGWYLPELAHPYHVLKDKKADIVVASPKGGEAPVDPSSLEPYKDDAACQNILGEDSYRYKKTEKLSSFLGKANEFDAIFYAGGVGPMFDIAKSADSQQLIREFWEAGKVVSAVCHGPCALAFVKLSDGSLLIKDADVTGFSNTEEEAAGTKPHVPFLLEDALKESGGKYSKASQDWGECVKVSKGGRLITGQNPASSKGVGEAIAAALKI